MPLQRLSGPCRKKGMSAMRSPDPKPPHRVLTARRLLAACAVAGTCVAGTASAAAASPATTHPGSPRTSTASNAAYPIIVPTGESSPIRPGATGRAARPQIQPSRPEPGVQPDAKPPAWSRTAVTPYKNTPTWTVSWAHVAGDTLAEGGGNGGLFLYHKTGGNTWAQTASFSAPPGQRGTFAQDQQDEAIDSAGDEVAVGDHPTRVYTLNNGTWSMTATLPEPADEAIGTTQHLAMSGNGRTIVTAGTLGSSYYLQTYRLSNAGKWRQLKTLASTNCGAVPASSLSLTKNGDILFANPYGDCNDPAVLQATLDPTSGAWKLVNSNLTNGIATNVSAGVSADASGNRIVVGQDIPPSSTNPDWTNGFVILDHTGGKWTLEGTSAPQTAPTGNTPAVAIDAAGDTANLIVQGDPAAGGGYVFDGYIYQEVSGKWLAIGWLKNPSASGVWDSWSREAAISPDGKFFAVADGVGQANSAYVYTSSQSAKRTSR